MLLRQHDQRAKLRGLDGLESKNTEVVVRSFLHDMCFWEMNAVSTLASSSVSSSPLDTRQQQQQQKQQDCRGYSDSYSPPAYNDKDLLQMEKELRWKEAIDPSSGRIYYYDSVTRETQWDKPAELRNWERQVKRKKQKKERAFFRAMENNILKSLKRGERIPGVPAHVDLTCYQQNGPSAAEPSQQQQQPAINNTNESIISIVNGTNTTSKQNVRTISGLDEHVLASLHHNNNGGHHVGSLSTRVEPRTASRRPENRNPENPEARRPPLHHPARVPSNGGSFSRLTTISGGAAIVAAKPPPVVRSGAERGVFSAQRSTSESTMDVPQTAAPEVAAAGKDKVVPVPTINTHMRRNTGGTYNVKSTMTNPNVTATIKCVCGVYRAHIVQGLEQRQRPQQPLGGRLFGIGSNNNNCGPSIPNVNLDIFRDDYELTRRARGRVRLPSLEEITTFYQEYFLRSQMEHDTIIMSLIYVERLMKATRGALAPTVENWRSLLFSCMIMASKVWDDLSMWNVDFSKVSVATGIAPFSLQRINDLELAVLTSLGFDVRVPASEYAKYYFLIRNMLLRSGLLVEHNNNGNTSAATATAPAALSEQEAQQLEHRTRQYQMDFVDNSTIQQQSRRTRSVDWEWLQQLKGSLDHGQPLQGPVLKDKICLEQLVAPKQ